MNFANLSYLFSFVIHIYISLMTKKPRLPPLPRPLPKQKKKKKEREGMWWTLQDLFTLAWVV